ncbi:MAG: XdhC family protein [Candidatus Limnocylindria bacterium]|nr:XdhC family protein [Candidatus Limnocylindria bacterium]
MRELYARMAELEREGRRFAVATVVRTIGSTPQVVGAKLVVDDLGRVNGTLGGGCVEGDAFDEAKRILAGGDASLREYELTEDLAWDTGLVCGGTMWIHVEPGDTALRVSGRDLLGNMLAASAGGKPVALTTLLRRTKVRPATAGQIASTGRPAKAVQPGTGKGTTTDEAAIAGPSSTVTEFAAAGRLFVESDGRSDGTLGAAALDARAREAAAEALNRGTARTVVIGDDLELLIEPVLARPRLVIAGGGHVALALARMAGLLEYEITVVEDRAEYAERERFPAGVEIAQGEIAPTLAALNVGWNTFIVIATRGHKMDAHCLRAAVKSDARYVGLLGSKRKTVLIAKMLAGEGVPDERLRAVHAPIGLDLGGRTPAEIALSVLAELSQERFGGTGRPLRLASEVFDRALAGR